MGPDRLCGNRVHTECTLPITVATKPQQRHEKQEACGRTYILNIMYFFAAVLLMFFTLLAVQLNRGPTKASSSHRSLACINNHRCCESVIKLQAKVKGLESRLRVLDYFTESHKLRARLDDAKKSMAMHKRKKVSKKEVHQAKPNDGADATPAGGEWPQPKKQKKARTELKWINWKPVINPNGEGEPSPSDEEVVEPGAPDGSVEAIHSSPSSEHYGSKQPGEQKVNEQTSGKWEDEPSAKPRRPHVAVHVLTPGEDGYNPDPSSPPHSPKESDSDPKKLVEGEADHDEDSGIDFSDFFPVNYFHVQGGRPVNKLAGNSNLYVEGTNAKWAVQEILKDPKGVKGHETFLIEVKNDEGSEESWLVMDHDKDSPNIKVSTVQKLVPANSDASEWTWVNDEFTVLTTPK